MEENMTATVGARITEFRRKMAQVNDIARKVPNTIVTKVNAKTDQFHKAMDSLASKITALGTVAGSVFKGGLLSALPALSPIIGSLVGGVGALASSFTALGGGLGAFFVAAIGNATKLGDSMGEIKKIKEKIAAERASLDPNMEKINELLNERANILGSMSTEQKAAMKQVNKFKQAWSDFLQVTEQPVFRVFAAGLKVATSLLHEIKPIIDPISQALTNLLNRFNAFSKTEQFRSFIDFFATRGSSALKNWGTIAGNVLTGFMELMKAFGPLGLSMENGLIGLTEQFAKWAAGLKNSKAFQNFVNFVKTNGPRVMTLIGQITQFIVNLGIGMAPLGQKILTLTNKFLGWINQMMRTFPIIGQVIAWLTSLGGALLAISPFIILVKSAFGGMATFIWAKTAMMRAKLVTGIAMMIKSLGKFIARMAVVAVQFAAKTVDMIFNAMRWAAQTIAQIAKVAARWAWMGIQAMLHAAKVAAAWTLAAGKRMAVAAAKMIATSAMFVAKWAWMGVKALLHAAKMAAAWFIALGPVGWVIATVIALVALIIANWDKVSSWTKKAWSAAVNFVQESWSKMWGKTKEIASKIYNWARDKFQAMKDAIGDKMNAAWDTITNIWGNVMDFFRGIDLTQIGRDIIQGLANGISGAAGWVYDKVKDIAGGIKDTLMFWTDSHSPSRMTEKIGGFVGQGLANGIIDKAREVKKSAKVLAQAAVPAVKDTFAMNTGFGMDMNIGVNDGYSGGSTVTNRNYERRTNNYNSSQDIYIENVNITAEEFEEMQQTVGVFKGFKQAMRKG